MFSFATGYVVKGAAESRDRSKALAIEARADIRLAEENEAARAADEVSAQGQRTDLVPDENKVPTTGEIGVDRKHIHRGRELRDAEAAEPGIVDRTIDELIAAGEEPTKAALKRKINGKAKKAKKPKPEPDPFSDLALWLWGRVLGFERQEYLLLDPEAVFAKMSGHMQADDRRLLPRVQTFLNRRERPEWARKPPASFPGQGIGVLASKLHPNNPDDVSIPTTTIVGLARAALVTSPAEQSAIVGLPPTPGSTFDRAFPRIDFPAASNLSDAYGCLR